MKRKVRVLVADDETHIRDLISWVMESLGAEVAGAEDGISAIKMFEQFQPDIVLLDVNMPKLSGVEVLKKIMSLNNKTLVIMLTAINVSETVEECIAEGAYNYLLKNTSAEELHEVLQELWQDCLQELKA